MWLARNLNLTPGSWFLPEFLSLGTLGTSPVPHCPSHWHSDGGLGQLTRPERTRVRRGSSRPCVVFKFGATAFESEGTRRLCCVRYTRRVQSRSGRAGHRGSAGIDERGTLLYGSFARKLRSMSSACRGLSLGTKCPVDGNE
jgi:hypothetical protein